LCDVDEILVMLRLVSSIACNHQPLARLFSSFASVPRVAIVGSGPAGFYTAQQLLKVSTGQSALFFPVHLAVIYFACHFDKHGGNLDLRNLHL